MTRINVFKYDEFDGKTLDGHFDFDRAVRIDEDTRWDGNNNVSVHTADKFAHQALFRTAGGRWVLNCWSQWEGSEETYEFIDDQQAREWLLVNKDDAAVERYFGEMPDEEGPNPGGRPVEIVDGQTFPVKFPRELVERVDAAAREAGLSRAGWLRHAAESYLTEGDPA